MATIGRLLAGLICACALLIAPLALRAEERINDYQVDIQVAEDGVLEVTERILINAENDQIVHGINREIPLAFIAADGHRARSLLTVLGVERDGETENYQVIETNRGVVVRIGSADVQLAPDEYLYEIRYRVNRIVSYFDEHDRLIWNVNGTEGTFPIDSLAVRLVLPNGAEPLAARAYTGRFGERGRDVSVSEYGDELTFEATRPYAVGENMTIDLLLPKGAIQPPDEGTLSEWWYHDHGSTIAAATTILLSALLAVVLWFLFGRDPRPGVIVPRWDAPGGMSPGRVSYSASRNFESGYWTAFSASIIDLAVKGELVLEDLQDGITVRKRSDEEDAATPKEQAVLMRMLPPAGEPFCFSSANAARTRKLGEAFCEAVAGEIGQKYYQPRTWVWISFMLLMLFALLVHELSYTAGVEYMDGWLPDHTLAALVAWVLAMIAIGMWRKLRLTSQRPSIKERFIILGNLVIATGIVVVFTGSVYDDAPVPRDGFLLTFTLAMTCTFLWACIGRLSREGREVMDGIAGLRLYLELAERDRLALAGAPTMTPAHFETLLPYAVALGVERAWTHHFEIALAEAKSSDAQGYCPPWYSQPELGALARIAEIGEFSSRIAGRIEHSLPSESDSQDAGWTGGSGSGRGGGGVSGW